MKDILTVFRFTLRDGARKKAFWVTTIIVLVLIVGICCVPRVMDLFSGGNASEPGSETPGTSVGEPAEKTETCYLIDEQQLIPGAAEALAAALPQADVIVGEESRLDSYKAEAETDGSVYIVQIQPSETGTLPKVQFYVHDIMSGTSTGTVTAALKAAYVSQAMQSAGVSADMTALALSDMAYDMAIVSKMDMSGYILGILLTMLTFFAVYYYGYGVAMSVASEKTSRVMETLVVSAKPSRILVGKILGMGVLGLLQMLMFLVVGALGYKLLVPADFTIGGMPLALSAFTPASALLILVYFLLGYALYAVLNSVCGATVSRTEDLNAAMMPTVFISLIAFYAAYLVMFIPNEAAKRVVTYIPFTSPFLLPFRLLNETVPAMDIVISLVLLIICIAVVALLSIRIYSASVLHYGQRLKLKDILRIR